MTRSQRSVLQQAIWQIQSAQDLIEAVESANMKADATFSLKLHEWYMYLDKLTDEIDQELMDQD
jgi:hypothetical protein